MHAADQQRIPADVRWPSSTLWLSTEKPTRFVHTMTYGKKTSVASQLQTQRGSGDVLRNMAMLLAFQNMTSFLTPPPSPPPRRLLYIYINWASTARWNHGSLTATTSTQPNTHSVACNPAVDHRSLSFQPRRHRVTTLGGRTNETNLKGALITAWGQQLPVELSG